MSHALAHDTDVVEARYPEKTDMTGQHGSTSTAGTAVEEDESIARLAESVERLMHLFARTRAQLLDRAHHDVDWSAQILMGLLVRHGPMRAKELSERVQSDPSTVSRQVGQLVRDGFVQRQADAVDGRASLLVATDKAHQAVADRRRVRDEHFARMVSGWDRADREQLAVLMRRFTEDFEDYKAALAGGEEPGRSGPGREESA